MSSKMKATLLHGDYLVKSRERLVKIIQVLKSRGWEIVKISSKDKLSLAEQLSADSLFQNKVLYVLEELNKIPVKDLEWLAKKGEGLEINLLLWSPGILPQKLKKYLPRGTKIEEFKLPRLIFKFLDSLYPKNGKNVLKLLHQLIKRDPIEFVFALMAKQYRDLYWALRDPQTLSYPSWRVGKLKAQAKKYSPEQLKKIIHQLAEIDLLVKRSQADLMTSLDLLIAAELE